MVRPILGRLSEDEIERMLKEAEENAEADKKERQKVEAKNQLEGYLYSLRNTLDDDGTYVLTLIPILSRTLLNPLELLL